MLYSETTVIQQLHIPQLDGAVDSLKSTNTPRKARASRYPELNVTVCQSPIRGDNLGQIIELLKDKNEVSLEPIAKRAKRT